jgi:hypothetical protein
VSLPDSPRLAGSECSSKLYLIAGQCIRLLYRNNMDSEGSSDVPLLVQNIVDLESRLATWRADLPTSLQYNDSVRSPREDGGPTGRLNVLLQMRYLSLRILIHRPILRLSLKALSGASMSAPHTDGLDELYEKPSLAILHRVAIEMIDLLDLASGPINMLGAWWFVLYYGKTSTQSSMDFADSVERSMPL